MNPSAGGRGGISWQLILADLSLILFMVTAGALSQAIRHRGGSAPALAALGLPVAAAASGPALAVYRERDGAPPLARWLAAQSADPRQQLTLVAQYAPGEADAALARLRARLAALGPAGARARIVLEPGDAPLTATLAYDAARPPPPRSPAPLARGLQREGGTASR